MGVAVTAFDAGLAMLKRDWQLFWSYRFRVVSQVLQAVISLTLFYYVSKLVRVPEVGGSKAYFASVVIGLVILEMLTSTLALLPLGLRQELVAGTFERLVVSPLGAVGSVVAMLLFPFLASVVLGTFTIAVAAIGFGMHVEWATAPLALPAVALATLAFAPFALLLASATLTVKQAGAGAGFLVSLLSLVGGFFFPVSLLPAWAEWLSKVQPFTPALGLLRHLLVGTPLTESAGVTLVKLALFAAVMLPVSLGVLRKGLQISRRRGTIIEY